MQKKEQVQREIEDESEWIQVSADFICAMVANGEPKFRKEDQARQRAVAK